MSLLNLRFLFALLLLITQHILSIKSEDGAENKCRRQLQKNRFLRANTGIDLPKVVTSTDIDSSSCTDLKGIFVLRLIVDQSVTFSICMQYI